MKARVHWHCLFSSVLGLGFASAVGAQCTNTALYPPEAIVPGGVGVLTPITGCSWQIEYSHIIGIMPTAQYRFTIADGSYITVHQGTPAGPVLGYGYSPLTVTAATSEDLFAHWNMDSLCAGAQNCLATTVELLLDCTPPAGSVGPVLVDCAAQQFFLDVTITDMGASNSVEIANSTGSGSLFATSLGTFTAGPFPLDISVDVFLLDNENALCNLDLGSFVNSPCTIPVVCPSVVNGSYCYDDFDFHFWLYESTTSVPLALEFSAGSIESAAYDHLALYDGTDNTAPLLWSHTSGNFNLAGLSVVSTSSSIYMEMSSDVSVACGSGQSEWFWSVGCLDCTQPSATFEIIPDCLHNAYSIGVNVTSTGSAPDVRIANSLTQDTLSGVGIGTTVIGPIPAGQTTQITILNSANELCRINSPALFLPAATCVVTACEPTAVEYCYTNSDTAWFMYESGSTWPITIHFDAGQLLPGDNVLVYNGIDASAQLVFQGDYGGQLAGLTLTSSNLDDGLTLKIGSNGYGSCTTGESTQPIHWTVGCGLSGVAEQTLPEFSIFPDPVSDELNIRCSTQLAGDISVDLYDLAGRCILAQLIKISTEGSLSIDLSAVQVGDYVIRLSAAHGRWTQHVHVVR
jgi:Secretion system C-terminal sorting domain